MTKLDRIIDIFFATLSGGLLLVLVPIAIAGMSYTAAPPPLIGIALGALVWGHLRGFNWAAKATVMLLVLGNIFAIFDFFPPFGDEVHPGLSLGERLLGLSFVTAACVSLIVVLYFRQRSRGAEPR
ncbi:hypothetical protein L2Y96_12100 [Luteibacter aegosomaticola]|uniref:hypothetical protein n=1 Tax=Luteibacter aegosomaticola TaxID=2911538 RepID=UPI001FFA70C6|nr:hypothetical protein [Luteibacter aegosomaticola]UPG88161.1 hypothetical protein L2Y96_12100 [Luteibacter aegosomaticola]